MLVKTKSSEKVLETPAVADLLDPIRDASYLHGQIIVDNPVLYNLSQYNDGINPPFTPQENTYLCWFGMPPGTDPLTESFNIYCAKAHPEKYTLGATPEQWLEEPFLLLSVQQLQRDVINWFNANYPAGASGGVGNAISPSDATGSYTQGNNTYYYLCNSTYGCINSLFPPGNVTGTPTVKQMHMVYDPIDNTVLLYVSMVTNNWTPNTKAIYVYKFPISVLQNRRSIDSYAVNGLTPQPTSYPPPANGVWFLGGLTLDLFTTLGLFQYWTVGNSASFMAANQFPAGVLSAPQFTISFDYLKLTAPYGYQLSNGYLPAILVAVEGYMTSIGTNDPPNGYPHGDGIIIALLQDIHQNPANPTVFRLPFPNNPYSPGSQSIPFITHLPATDITPFGTNVDKFGSILPMVSHGIIAGYTVLFSTPSRQDFKLSSMRVEALFIKPPLYLDPVVAGAMGFDTSPAVFVAARTKSIITPTYPAMGYCRPYLYTLPNGQTIVTFGGYYYTNYINGKAALIDPSVLDPDNHKELYALLANPATLNTGTVGGLTYPIFAWQPFNAPVSMLGRLFGSFGKKYARIYTSYSGYAITSHILIVAKYIENSANSYSWFNGGGTWNAPSYPSFSMYRYGREGTEYYGTATISIAELNDIGFPGSANFAIVLTDEVR